MIDTLPATHPRIILTDERVAELKAVLAADKDLQVLVAGLGTVGESILRQPPVTYDLKGVKRFRLLSTSRLALSRALVLGTLYRLDGQEKWKDRLVAELLAVCAFKDWHPSHFLDTAEMAAAVALGYDWLYESLDENTRRTIRDGLIRHGLKACPPKGWWVRGHNNWNQVCHGGMVLAALAVAQDSPDAAEALLQSAKKNFVTGLQAYAPAGVYPEGPGYWNYGTSYSVLMDAAVRSALGADWGPLEMPGFKESFTYRMHVQGPTGRDVNYADGGDHSKSSPYHFYLAAQTGTPGYSSFAMNSMQVDLQKIGNPKNKDVLDRKINRFYPLAIAWYVPEKAAADLPLDWAGAEGDASVHLATLRSAWGDKQALFASLKAGVFQVNHGHLDAGSFIIESDGVRWASDLGSEKEIYDRNDAWSLKQNSKRWDFFRANNFSHNTLTIDNQLHRVEGSAPIVASGSGDFPFAVADLSMAFEGQASSVKRGLAMPGRRQILVQDEISGVAEGKNIRWNLMTRATVRLSDDRRTARMTLDNQTMTVSLLAPSVAAFRVTDATTAVKEENQNAGYQRLLIDIDSKGTDLTLAVLFSPGEAAAPGRPVSPLASWQNATDTDPK